MFGLLHFKPELTPDFIADLEHTYRELHATPELSAQEYRTASYIEHRLEKLGLTVFRCGTTGVVGLLRNGAGPVVAYRADTDGLPVREKTGLTYASTATGILNGVEVPIMHACGHDVHMAVGIKSAELLATHKEDWTGTVVFIFQPAEETAVGAKAMVSDGLWNKAPRPDIILGQHVMPYQAGKVFLPSGPAMSMADSWRITIRGRGSHGSQPEESIDPIVVGAAVVMRLQTIVSREISPRETAVVTVGTFHAGLKENIIPDTAELTVNVRTFSDDVRNRVLAAIRRIVMAEALAAGAPEPLIEEVSTFPPCYNDPDEISSLATAMAHALGSDNVVECPPHMASEDFGYLGQSIDVPTLYWFLGGVPEERLNGPVPVNHSPLFAPVIEPTLAVGVTAATTAILSRLHTTGAAPHEPAENSLGRGGL